MPARTTGAPSAGKPALLRLAQRLDQKTALALVEGLRARRGADLCLDASETTQIGTLAVQAILAAARTWARDGHRLTLVSVSDGCVDQLHLLGFTPESLVEGACS